MNLDSSLGLASGAVLIFVWVVLALALLVWYLWAMSRLFSRIGLKSSEGWVPVYNQWRLLERAGLPGWVVLLAFIGLGVIPFIMLIIAMHRINTQYGASAGYTVLGAFIAPLWAMLLTSHIDQDRAQALRPTAAPSAPSAPGGPHHPAPPHAPWAAAPASTPGPAAANLASPQHPPAASSGHLQPPLGGDTEAEYLRLAAEGFKVPPSVPLGPRSAPRPFSWTSAARPPQPPIDPAVDIREPAEFPPVAPEFAPGAPELAAPATPAASVFRPTGITGRVAPLPSNDETIVTPARETQPDQDGLDHTVVVARKPNWVIELPDGTRLQLDRDVVVGRRPSPVAGSAVLEIPDSTRTLSKSHARLTFDGKAWLIEDLASTNGLVLILDDGTEQELSPGVPTAATTRMLFGTLEVKLLPMGDGA